MIGRQPGSLGVFLQIRMRKVERNLFKHPDPGPIERKTQGLFAFVHASLSLSCWIPVFMKALACEAWSLSAWHGMGLHEVEPHPSNP